MQHQEFRKRVAQPGTGHKRQLLQPHSADMQPPRTDKVVAAAEAGAGAEAALSGLEPLAH